MNFRVFDAHTLGISLDETTTDKDLVDILAVFNGGAAPDVCHRGQVRNYRREMVS